MNLEPAFRISLFPVVLGVFSVASAAAHDDFFETFPDGSHPEPSGIYEPGMSGNGPGLTGRIVFTSAGHGWTYDNGGSDRPPRWYTQRGVGHEMNEDYGNLDQMNFFVDYCFNAGATVVAMRPVGFQTNEVVLDNVSPGVVFRGEWFDSQSDVYHGRPGDVPYRFARLAQRETATATYTPDIPRAGFYPVYTWARHGSDRTGQLYRINHTGGESLRRIPHHVVGNGWVYLGVYYFAAGASPRGGSVVVSNLQPDPAFGSVVIADAIRFGNGMGDIVPRPKAEETPPLSSYPREEEASLYWVAASLGQGQRRSIYASMSADSSANVGAPIRMAREMNRVSVEPDMFKRIYIGFHSNAGGGRGAIGLYNDPDRFAGTATPNQLRLAELIGREVNDYLSAMTVPPLEAPWFDRVARGQRIVFARNDYAFGEINNRTIQDAFDATLIEVAFHDHAEDAKLLRDPKVRDAAARASYQSVVRYMHEFDGAPLVFLPEPPQNVRAISTGEGVRVSWTKSPSGDAPSAYRVYRSRDGYGFGNPVEVRGQETTSVLLRGLPLETAFYFQVTAVNSAGESFPSRTLGAFRRVSPVSGKVLFVNAFNRLDRHLNLRQTPVALKYAPPGPEGTMERVLPRWSNAYNYVVQHGAALGAAGVAFDSCQNEAVIRGEVRLADYEAVLWALGNETEVLTGAEQVLLAEYLQAGGNLLISGANVASGLRQGGVADGNREFPERAFKASFAGALEVSSTVTRVEPAPGSIFTGLSPAEFDDGSRGIYAVRRADQLAGAESGARTALQFASGSAAAIQYDGRQGDGRLVLMGFPFETITSARLRHAWMERIASFFALRYPVPLAAPELAATADAVTLTWDSVPGARYQVQYKQSFDAGLWRNLGAPVTADSSRTQFEDAPEQTRFYRVLERD